ncbi:hypothetical protein ACROYT_G002479 [Oculina patagonica]
MSVYQNTSMDTMNSATVALPSEYCRRFQDEEKFLTMNLSVTLTSIILNTFSCPFVILMNALVIVAVKTRHRLQTMSNILLASLAGTDLLMGTTTLPASVAAEIFAIADGSVTTYCTFVNKIVSPFCSGRGGCFNSERDADLEKAKSVVPSEHVASDTFTFIREINGLSMEGKFMVSFDVESLFTNIPLSECIDLADDHITEGNADIKLSTSDLKRLFLFATAETHFIFKGTL